VEDHLGQLEAAEVAARDAAEDARRQRDALADQLQQLNSDVVEAETRLAEQQRRLEERRTQLAADRERVGDAQLEAALEQASGDAQQAHEAVATAQAELDELGADEVELLATNHQQRLEAARQRLAEVRDELTRLQVGVELRGGEGIGQSLQAAEAELERAEDRRRGLRGRAEAVKLLLDAFEEAREAAYAAYREPLRQRIVRAGQVVFGDELDVELDEQLSVVARRLGGTRLGWQQLSAGAREQLAILAALATADLAGGQHGEGVPLVLDDTLGYTDPARLERLGAVLGAVRGPQVVVLTCVGERFRAIGSATVVRLDRAPLPSS
ncbi:MAG: ATP-binding protein, partial [Nitriliruptoraceae bacterium]